MDGLFADSAGARRRRIDRMALALDPLHTRCLARYETALRERNRLLETGAEAAWLDAVEAQAGEHGERPAQGRAQLVQRLGDALSARPDRPSPRPPLTYRPGGRTHRPAVARATAGRGRGGDG